MKERAGLLFSSAAHVALLAYAFIGLSSAKPFEVGPTEALPIEIMSPQEFDAMTKGSKTSKKVDAPAQKAEQLADADSEPVDDDTPVAKEDVKAPPPPPPPAAAAETPPVPDPAKARAEAAAKAEAERAEKAEKAEAAEKAAKAEAAKAEAVKAEAAKAAAAKAEAAKAEKAAAAKAAELKAEKLAQAEEAELRAKAAEAEKVAKEKADKIAKAEAEQAAKEKAEKIAKAEAEKAAKEKAEAEKAAKLAQEKADKEKLEKIAKAEAEKAEKAEKAAKAEADRVAKAEAAAKAAKEKADAEKAAKAAERKFDPSKIAGLIGNKPSSSDSALKDARDPGRKAASGRQLAPETTAGTSRGTATKLSMSQRVGIDNAVREQISQCWSPPVGASGGDNIVRVRFTLNADGSLSDGPTVDSGGAPRAFADAAARAVRRCSPLKLPADAYDYWRQVDIRFDPKDMMGG